MSDPTAAAPAPAGLPGLTLLGAGSPVLQLLGSTDSADVMVCGLDGVCRPATASELNGSSPEHDAE